jgi:hypothetical protein
LFLLLKFDAMNIILNDIPQGQIIKNIKFEISFENGVAVTPNVIVDTQTKETSNNLNSVPKIDSIENREQKDVPDEMLNTEF